MSFKFFHDSFPPPKFLDVPYAGISVSDDSIRCIKFTKRNKKNIIESFIEKPVPLGVIISGVIKNSIEFSNILESIKKEMKLDLVKVSIPEENAYLFNAKIPKVNPSEIKSAIEFKMEENVPIPNSELIFDYVITTPYGHDDHVDVVVSALPVSVVNDYVEAVQRSGLSILSLEIESQAIARALLPKNCDKTYLIVHFNKQKVGLYVATCGVVHFTSTILIKENITNDLQSITNEIKKLYVYWHTLKENAGEESKKISNIVVCGEDANEETVSYLATHVKSNVVLANVWANAFDINEIVPTVSFKQSLNFAPAVGLALPQDILI